MKRDPKENYVKRHMNSINVRKIKPIFYCKCVKCGMEYKRETMYECSFLDDWFEYTVEKTGCTECFSSKYDFLKWLQNKNILYTEEWLRGSVSK